MRLYLDASVLVSLLARDASTPRAYALLRSQPPVLLVSDFAAAEFASALGRRVRTGELTVEDGRAAFANFDLWATRAARRVETTAADVGAAEVFLRRLDLSPRTPDALNIAIAQRTGGALATFDEKMATAACELGVGVVAQ